MRRFVLALTVLILILPLVAGMTNVAASCGGGGQGKGAAPPFAPDNNGHVAADCGNGGGGNANIQVPGTSPTRCANEQPCPVRWKVRHPGSDANATNSTLTESVGIGPIGATVNVSTTLASADMSCTLSSPTLGLVTNSSCSMLDGNAEASFVVGNVAPGTYILQMTGSSSDYATLTFTVSQSLT